MSKRFILPTIGLAAIALGACGGPGVPAAGVPAALAPARIARPAAEPCHTSADQPKWIFKGACKTTTLTAAGTTIKLVPYKGITVSVELPATTLKKSVLVTLADATGANDILPYQGKTFPLYAGSAKAMVYVQSVVHSSAEIPVRASSAMVFAVAAARFPGSSCKLAALDGRTWHALPPAVSPKNGVLTISLPGSEITSLAAGAGFSAVVCS
ncbi:MAG TPA: hypothetical protein VMH02_12750 [Verrucomicrobiae bacterium]|nr:hypothetical protein [Verrucomicrobiae bacterium]